MKDIYFALSKLRTAIFDESQEIIFDNYVQQIFLEGFKEYDAIFKKYGSSKRGFKNIDNAKLVYCKRKT